MEQIYAASVWSRLVKERFRYACSQCGSDEDVQAVHVIPPSLGGKNTLENGITLCLQCRTKRILVDGILRFNFAISESLYKSLLAYCEKSGRSSRDVVKQLVADFAFDPDAKIDGRYQDGDMVTHRLSVPVRQRVFSEFSGKCSKSGMSPAEVVNSLLYRYLSCREVNYDLGRS